MYINNTENSEKYVPENKNVIFRNIWTQQHDVGDIFFAENLYEILNVFRYFAVLKIYFCSLFSYL